MISKTIASCLILLFLVSVSFGQQTEYVYYLNADLGVCKKEKSVFTGHGIIENNLLNLKVYSNKFPEKPLLIANFTDSTLSINQGSFQTFYLNGKEESNCSYNNNVLDGLWEKWDSTGHLTDSLLYVNGQVTDSSKFYYSENGTMNSFSSTDFKNDIFHQTFYNDSGKVSSEVYFTGQKGILKDYENGKLTIDSLFTREEIEASFPGGAMAWFHYIAGKVQQNIGDFTNQDNGTCLVRFIIDTDGRVSDVQATTMKGTLLSKVAVEAIETGPKWIPAIQYGRFVRAYRLQPVTVQSPSR